MKQGHHAAAREYLNLKGDSQSDCHALRAENEVAKGAMGAQWRKALS